MQTAICSVSQSNAMTASDVTDQLSVTNGDKLENVQGFYEVVAYDVFMTNLKSHNHSQRLKKQTNFNK